MVADLDRPVLAEERANVAIGNVSIQETVLGAGVDLNLFVGDEIVTRYRRITERDLRGETITRTLTELGGSVSLMGIFDCLPSLLDAKALNQLGNRLTSVRKFRRDLMLLEETVLYLPANSRRRTKGAVIRGMGVKERVCQ